MILKKYFLQTFSQTFFPIFLTLFLITSIIFLVKIASLTSVIQLNFLELIELFSYNIPTILFYTLPVTLFIGLALTFSKLSSEYELIVVTSFGQNPLKILKVFLPFLVSITLLIFIISVFLVPKADFLQIKFKANKQVQAQFNIQPSEYGQEFANWLIYVNKKENEIYKDIVLFKHTEDNVIFIIADTANTDKLGKSMNLNLQKGKLFEIGNSFQQIDFEKMILHNELQSMESLDSFSDLVKYWSIQKEKLTFYILGSFFPLLSVFFILYAGYFNPRYEKNRTVAISMAATVIFIIVSQKLSKTLELQLLIYLPIIWVSIGYYLYHIKTKQAY